MTLHLLTSVAFDVLAKASVLLLLGLLGHALLGWLRKDLVRAAFWNATLVALLLLPVTSLLLPRLRVPCLPPPASLSVAVVEQPIHAAPAAPSAAREPAADAGSAVAPVVAPVSADVGPAGRSDAAAAPVAVVSTPNTAPTSPAAFPWRLFLWGAYVLGALVLGARLASGAWQLQRLRRGAVPLQSPAWLHALATVQERLGLAGAVQLVTSSDLRIPATFGALRPMVVIPPHFARDSVAIDREAVLWHELSHVRRGDFRWQLALHAVQMLYWPNPLVWLAGRCVGRAREDVCDRVCVHHLGDRHSYRTTLINVAKSLLPRPAATLGIGMARSSKIARRLSWLQGTQGMRNCLAWWPVRASLLSTLAVIACVLGPLELTRAAVGRRAVNKKIAAATEGAFVAKLAGGGAVELIAVGAHPTGTSKSWWQADGKSRDALYEQFPGALPTDTSRKSYEFAVRLVDVDAQATVSMDVAHGGSRVGPVRFTQPSGPWQDIWVTAVSLPGDVRTASLRVAVSQGPWQTRARRTDASGTWAALAVSGNGCAAMFAQPVEVDGQTQITVAHDQLGGGVRLIAIDVEGKLHESVATDALTTDGFAQCSSRFDLPLAQIARFELQTREVWKEWVGFENIALAPGEQTTVVVRSGASASSDAPTAAPSLVTRCSFGMTIAPEMRGPDTTVPGGMAAQRLVAELERDGPQALAAASERLCWVPVRPGLVGLQTLVHGTYAGQEYVLVDTQPGMYLVPGTPLEWGLRDAQTETVDGRSRVCVTLDERGATKLEQMTRNRIRQMIVLLVDGRVESAARLMSAVSRVSCITGDFTAAECETLAARLRGVSALD